MKRSAVPTAVLLAAIALVALLVYGVAQKGNDRTLDDAVKKGSFPAAPDQSRRLPVLGDDATKKSLGDYRGQVVVLNFWASWCDPCEEEAPFLKRAQRALTKAGGGTVLGATFNDTPGDSQEFLRRHALTYPNLRDVGTRLAKAFGTNALPETFVLDAKGQIVAISRGGISSDAFLTKAIAKAKARS